MGRGGLNEPAMRANGSNDADASFGSWVIFFFRFFFMFY